ncbi:MAG: hypothetical protein ACAH83_04815 [Alphaproteobacteria bacterium]
MPSMSSIWAAQDRQAKRDLAVTLTAIFAASAILGVWGHSLDNKAAAAHHAPQTVTQTHTPGSLK